MILRSKFPKPKQVMLVCDTPFKVEEESEEKYSSVANMSLLTSLRTGRVNNYGKTDVDKSYKGINSVDIFATYLDYSYFEQGNFDFCRDFKKRKDLEVDKSNEIETYHFITEESNIELFKLPHQKDVYVSERLWNEFQSLLREIEIVKPKLIILTGKWSLFFLTGCTSLVQNSGNAKDRKPLGGLSKFRSSIMSPHECWNLKYIEDNEELFNPIIIPVFHTVHAISMPDKVSTMVLDIQKLGWVYNQIKEKGLSYYTKPKKEYVVCNSLPETRQKLKLLKLEKPTEEIETEIESLNKQIKIQKQSDKQKLLNYLDNLYKRIEEKPTKVSIDIETMYWSVIDCIGITDSIDSGVCVPFSFKGEPNYWDIEDEIDLLEAIRKIMLHPNCLHVGQNYSFDCQFFHKFWSIDVKATYDSMILHHVLYNYLPKNLSFLASLYCEHYGYWKDELDVSEDNPEQRWVYNVKDVCYTLEVTNVLLDLLYKQPEKVQEFYRFQQNEIAPALVDMMNRGLKVDLDKKQKLLDELTGLLAHIETSINKLLGMEINLKSPIQIKKLFKDFLEVEPIVNRKTKTESFGSDAMLVYLVDYPLYRPLITLILEYRSIGVFVRTFLSAKVDDDNRMRTSYNVAGTKTYRLASRKNAFGGGLNMQNIPSKGKIDLKYSLLSLSMEDDSEVSEIDTTTSMYGMTDLPNCKELFICEEDEIFFDIDLAAADARIIAWVSGCKFLTELFEDPEGDPYLLLAKEYYKNNSLNKKSKERQIFKAVAHGSNYLGRANTLAAKAGLSVHAVDQVQKFYFGLCPEIPKLHIEVEKQVKGRGYLENVWGAKGWFLDKNDPMLLNQAMAWVGSSPVGILINKGLVKIYTTEKHITPRLQVHDSIAGTYKKWDTTAKERIIKHCSVPLPFDIPRVIPVDIKTSDKSYGNCGEIEELEKKMRDLNKC